MIVLVVNTPFDQHDFETFNSIRRALVKVLNHIHVVPDCILPLCLVSFVYIRSTSVGSVM